MRRELRTDEAHRSLPRHRSRALWRHRADTYRACIERVGVAEQLVFDTTYYTGNTSHHRGRTPRANPEKHHEPAAYDAPSTRPTVPAGYAPSAKSARPASSAATS